MSNHLGNCHGCWVLSNKTLTSHHPERSVSETSGVLAVVTDRKVPIRSGSTNYCAFFLPNVVSYSDYYPFGMQMPGRNDASSTARYGFNSMERDDELKGEGNSYDFGARMYDSRLGRFLSIDPLTHVTPWSSPYTFAGNSPIWFIDHLGEIPVHFMVEFLGKTYKVTLDTEDARYIKIKQKGKRALETRLVTNNPQRGSESLDLLKARYSRVLKESNHDQPVVTQTYNGVPLNRLILALVNQNSEQLGLVIIGNHRVATRQQDMEVANSLSGSRRDRELLNIQRRINERMYDLLRSCNDPARPMCIAVREEDRNFETEVAWTLERADYVKELFFNNSSNVQTYSAGQVSPNTFPGITLPQLGMDARGITIAFDLRNTSTPSPREKKKKKEPSREKSKNPRFL